MRGQRRAWWVLYGAGALLALGALSWITATVLELERRENLARCSADHQEALRLSLWRMDSWFAAHRTREDVRPFYEYLPFYAPERAYTSMLYAVDPGELLSPSPLLQEQPGLVRLHFQVDEQGRFSSPQVPEGNFLDLAQSGLVPPERIERAREELRRLAVRTSRAGLEAELETAAGRMAETLARAPAPETAYAPAQLAQLDALSQQEFKNIQETSARVQAVNPKQKLQLEDVGANWIKGCESTIDVGVFVPLWLDGGGGALELAFVRRVSGAGRELLQGFVVDWDALGARLLDQARDLLPGARLEPVRPGRDGDSASGTRLATVPALLRAEPPAPAARAALTPARWTLGLSWLAALMAIAAVGWALRSSVLYGEKRSRFASTVTHELRTPLTTFRMYSEMLARGMVPEEARAEYLETLQRESDRLAGLVENVLAYARLEDGRAPLRRRRVPLGELLDAALPALERRAREAGVALEVDAATLAGAEVETDPDAVGQILFNLVDNACKYGRAEDGSPVRLSAAARAERVELRVRDAGAGVPAACARSIFHPFERGALDPADPNPGIGLGLALARGLARDLGGELLLEAADGRGASFLLTLRRAS